MSLEVDGRPGGVPIPHQSDGEGFKFVNGQDTYYNASHARELYITSTAQGYSQHQQPSKPEGSGQGGGVRPRSMFHWWILFVIVAVLVAVPAAVAGSIAARRGRHFDGWYVFGFQIACEAWCGYADGWTACSMQKLQDLNVTLNAASHHPNDTTNATRQNSDLASFTPTTDCTSLASPYTPSSNILGLPTSNESFNIHCETDYEDADWSVDFMAFLAFTFEDCIVGCANYNQRVPTLHPNSTCYGVSFDNYGGENQKPNCYLKGVRNPAPTPNRNASSALLITSR